MRGTIHQYKYGVKEISYSHAYNCNPFKYSNYLDTSINNSISVSVIYSPFINQSVIVYNIHFDVIINIENGINFIKYYI